MDQSFEYLGHTADVIIHSWGPNIAKAFEAGAYAMFDYMTDLTRICEVRKTGTSVYLEPEPSRLSYILILNF